jgi:hypothetical protein
VTMTKSLRWCATSPSRARISPVVVCRRRQQQTAAAYGDQQAATCANLQVTGAAAASLVSFPALACHTTAARMPVLALSDVQTLIKAAIALLYPLPLSQQHSATTAAANSTTNKRQVIQNHCMHSHLPRHRSQTQ